MPPPRVLPPVFYKLAYELRRIYWLVFRPNVYGVRCVIEHDGQIVLIKQTYGDRRWTIPGGAVKRGETSEAAARREVDEELGIHLLGVALFYEFTSTDNYMHDHVNCFRAEAPGKDMTIHRGEVREARWFALDRLPDDLVPEAMMLIEKYAGQMAGSL